MRLLAVRSLACVAIAALSASAPLAIAGPPAMPPPAMVPASVVPLGQTGLLLLSSGSLRAVEARANANGAAPAMRESSLVPAGDLNGDGRADVLERRSRTTSSAATLLLFARDEATGGLLWQRSVVRPVGHLLDAFPARTGRPGKPGVVLADYWRVQSGNTITDHLAVAGLDSRGNKLWSAVLTGTEETSGTKRRFMHDPAEISIEQFRPGASDVFVPLTDTEEDSAGSTPTTGAVSFATISGADGSLRHLGSTVRSDDTEPTWGVLPDQDGNGYEDIYVADPGQAASLIARSGVTGRAIWSTTLPSARTLGSGYWFMAPAGYLTRGTRNRRALEDLLVLSSNPAPAQVAGAQVPLDPRTDSHGQAVLLAAGSGKPIWIRPADAAVPLRAAGASHQPAVALLLNDDREPTGEGPRSLTTSAIDVGGTQLWAASVPDGTTLGDTNISIQGIGEGDVNGDGTTDIAANTFVGDAGQRSSVRTIDGESGRVTSSSVADPLWASLDGHGDDVARITAGNTLRLDVLAGDSGKLLFSRAFGGASAISAIPTYATARACADLLVTADGPVSTTAVLAGNGDVLWRILRKDDDTDPGAVLDRHPRPTGCRANTARP